MVTKSPSTWLAILAAAALFAAACRSTHETFIATPTPTVEPISYGPLAARAFVTPDYVHWVDLQGEFLLAAQEAAQRHSIALAGDAVGFTESPSATVSDDESKVLVGIRSGDGRPGVLLVRRDGSSMGMYVFTDRSTTFDNVGFAPWAGMTLFGASDSTGSRIVAINNYAYILFELPVQDHRGRVLVSPDLEYVALVREGEVELAPLETPGETTIIREGARSADGRDVYRDALRLVSRW